jgi:hypothetical protein
LLISIDGDTVPLAISEEQDRVEHVPSARELAEQKRSPWTRIPTHDQVASGRLRISLGGSARSERRSFWADRKSWRVEDKLPELMREVAVRAGELRLRREAKARAEVEYRQAVDAERQRARHRAAEAHRVKSLDEQLERWQEVTVLRAYANALATRIELAEGGAKTERMDLAAAREWLTWIEARANQRDPLRQLPRMPTAPDLPDYMLSEFMHRVPEPSDLRYEPDTY